jgi:hypothetical protein
MRALQPKGRSRCATVASAARFGRRRAGPGVWGQLRMVPSESVSMVRQATSLVLRLSVKRSSLSNPHKPRRHTTAV